MREQISEAGAGEEGQKGTWGPGGCRVACASTPADAGSRRRALLVLLPSYTPGNNKPLASRRDWLSIKNNILKMQGNCKFVL